MSRRQGGFTLIEMIVVLAVMGLAIGLVITHGPMHSEHLSLEAATREMAGSLRLARSRAIALDRTVTVTLTTATYQMDTSMPRRLPETVTMAGNAAIAFRPDGSSSGGHIVMQGGDLRTMIVVDWLTGRVRIPDKL